VRVLRIERGKVMLKPCGQNNHSAPHFATRLTKEPS
jgi:hypothetical protein